MLIGDDEATAAIVRALRALQAVQSDVQIERAFIAAAWLLLRRGRDEQAAITVGAAATAMSDKLRIWWRPSMDDVLPAVRALAVDPRWKEATDRGRRRRPLEWVDVVISWLEAA